MAEFDWYGDGGPVGGYGNNTGGGGDDSGGDSGGGSELFVVTFSGYGSTYWTADKTFQEIHDAVRSGKIVIGRRISILDNGTVSGAEQYNLSYFSGMEDEGAFALFTLINIGGGKAQYWYYTYNSDGSIERTMMAST